MPLTRQLPISTPHNQDDRRGRVEGFGRLGGGGGGRGCFIKHDAWERVPSGRQRVNNYTRGVYAVCRARRLPVGLRLTRRGGGGLK